MAVVCGGVCVCLHVYLTFKYMNIGLNTCQMFNLLLIQVVTREANKGF